MSFSKGLVSLKKATVVATLIMGTTCLVSDSAQAGLSPGKTRATNGTGVNFNLNDSTGGGNGFFPGAIENFNIGEPNFYNLTNSDFCGNEVCPAGNLTISKLTIGFDGNITGLNFSLDDINREINSDQNFSGTFKTKILDEPNIIRYDVTFGNNNDPKLIWFIESNDLSLINDISNLNKFNPIVGKYVNLGPEDSVFELNLEASQPVSETPQEVPEPSATFGLLSVGVLGAFLLKRNKH